MDAVERISESLRQLLQPMEPPDQQEQYQEILDLLDRESLLDSYPSRRTPAEFARQLFSPNRNPQLAYLAKQARPPQGADSPLDLVLALLPSDGHLE